ncbi:MAG TPA: S-methyl-5'-thioinosine phosphorylase [Nitrosomonas europaea]|uniref:S-methyl-5'-thioinosine phosphorylase n=1 Tax=Nitrosomonas europaea TaxID=915 RepID=UPI00249024D3|nr:S-methyl-5'-thioinosine phosphorylase [Nitrosomonas europaea]MCE7916425.1 S-methyl-5'-thioinosine phosphorylase [Nitrosomonas sp. PRO5]HRO56280.1 S-methyl-5'-thioinosine phosphorylase [Nitrosomonas europaea]HUM73835.1 S-methyl-5'-thioinosine phosphorylase [Nitrosomonas europaea]
MLAIIGGRSMNKLAGLEVTHRQVMRTPYGEPSGALIFGTIGTREIVFLSRHGHGLTIPPHAVNYRANIWVLSTLKIKTIVAVASVGGIRKDMGPGKIVVPDQIIDYTHSREATFHGRSNGTIIHTDFTQPYCSQTRTSLLQAARDAGESVIDGGVYAATQGPRFETAAEINRLERDGADLVGMTGMPEAILARELGISYATIAAVANHAAGRGESIQAIPLQAAHLALENAMGSVRNILEHLVRNHDD